MRTSYTRPQPNFQGASRGNKRELLQTLFYFQNQIADLQRKTQTSAQNSQNQNFVAGKPTQAGFQVGTSGSNIVVRITNPEFNKARPGNRPRTLIYHKLEASPYANFSRQVTSFPVSSQTYYNISELGTGSLHLRLTSSYDGVNFNSPQVSKIVVAK